MTTCDLPEMRDSDDDHKVEDAGGDGEGKKEGQIDGDALSGACCSTGQVAQFWVALVLLHTAHVGGRRRWGKK